MLYNYRSRQFHITSNGINPPSASGDMASTKSGQSAVSLDKFWAMGKANMGQMGKLLWQCTTTNLDPGTRQVHKTLDWLNRSSGFRDLRSAKPGTSLCQSFLAHGQAHKGQMGKWPCQCTTTGLDNSTELRTEKIRQAVTEIYGFRKSGSRPPGRLRGKTLFLFFSIVNSRHKDSKPWQLTSNFPVSGVSPFWCKQTIRR